MSAAASGGRAAGEQHYLDRFQSFATRGAGPGWLETLREDAIASFAELGFPSRALEEWRHTNVAPMARIIFELQDGGDCDPTADDLAGFMRPEADAWRAVFVDGRLCAQYSVLPVGSDGLRVMSLAEARVGGEGEDLIAQHLSQQAAVKDGAFTALNTAFIDDGAVIEIPSVQRVERPLHLLFVSTGDGSVSHPRNLVVARTGSRATLIQDHVSLGSGTCFTNAVCEVTLEQDAQLDMVLVQRENPTSYHISNLQAVQQRDSRFSLHTLTIGGALVRNELGLLLEGPGAETDLRGLFLGVGHRHVDNHTRVDHAVPSCTSRELYKGILGDHSHGVFRGRVVVRPDAQKSDAYQSNPNLLLTDQAGIDTQPQLEIRADDVKCSHGSTIGQLDQEALFYLRSRGVEETAARALLTRGFAAEITAGLSPSSLADWARDLVGGALEDLMRAAGGGDS